MSFYSLHVSSRTKKVVLASSSSSSSSSSSLESQEDSDLNMINSDIDVIKEQVRGQSFNIYCNYAVYFMAKQQIICSRFSQEK